MSAKSEPFSDLLSANSAYAAQFDLAGLPAGAARGLAVVTCIDSRIEPLAMPSGAGHDAQDFTRAGYPAAMIFVRNAHGSHNPDEAMDLDDFALGTQLLARFLTT